MAQGLSVTASNSLNHQRVLSSEPIGPDTQPELQNVIDEPELSLHSVTLTPESTDENQILPLKSRGILEWSYQTSESSYISTPTLVDLNGNGDLEVVFLTDADALYTLTSDGKFRW